MTPSENDRRIDYIEFPARDLSTTKAFYTSLFGWAFEDYGPEYTSFHDGRLAGGFFTSNDYVCGGPLVVIFADDLELMKANVLKLGAKLTKDIFEFPGGRRFQFLDPNGHELSIWSNP
jgi:predicted enzyme related to lactoylglutathione lyase